MKTYKNNQGVLVVIYASLERKFLLLKRLDSQDFWQSVTGTMEQGETLYQTALREVFEETGINITASNIELNDLNQQVEFKIFDEFRYKYPPHISTFTEHWFACDLKNCITPRLIEHSDFMWCEQQDAIELCRSPSNQEAIASIIF